MFTNYRYYTDKKTIVVAKTTYAGKTVKGIAKCAPEDKFDLESGKALAAARCNLKVAKLRNKRARRKYNEINNKLQEVDKKFHETCNYLKDSAAAVNSAQDHLNKLLSRY